MFGIFCPKKAGTFEEGNYLAKVRRVVILHLPQLRNQSSVVASAAYIVSYFSFLDKRYNRPGCTHSRSKTMWSKYKLVLIFTVEQYEWTWV